RNGTIAWVDYRNQNWDIYAFNLSTMTEYPVCNQPEDQGWPAVGHDTIVWQDYRGGNTAIYAARIPG
ncbi:MAG TPA: hypothetical protein PK089_07570, partial [Methanoregulaceae archaeon]|nr:hypothetical protein [Methanoregulaceae archaeon]